MPDTPADDIAVQIERLRDHRGVLKRSAARKLAALGGIAAPALDALTDAMTDPDGTVRTEVARALRAIAEPSLLALWISALSDAEQSVVWVAEHALVDLGGDAVPALIDELVARTDIGRRKAPLVLGRIGMPAIPALLKLRDSEHSELRHRAGGALVHIEQTAPDEAIARAMSSELNPVRRFAAHVLVMRASPDAIPAWIARLSDSDPWLRQTAARALAELAEDAEDALVALIGALDDDDAAVAVVAARALGAIRQQAAIPYLVAAFRTHAHLREAVVHALCDIKRGSSGLVQCGPRTISTLLDIVGEDNKDRARVALEALGGYGAESRVAIPTLLDALPDLRTRYLAHTALVNVGEPAVEPLLGRFAAEPDLRTCIASILGELGDTRAFSTLLEALCGCESDDVRAYLEALGQLGDRRALPDIAPYCAAQEARTRQSAILALGLLGAPSSVALVSERLADEDVHVQIAAVRALEQIGGDAALASLIEALGAGLGSSVTERIADALGSFGPAGQAAVPGLINALRDKSQLIWEYVSDAWHKPGGDQHYWVRLFAARSLGRIGDAAAASALAQAARATPDDWWVREEIAFALGELAGDEAKAALSELAGDPQREVCDAARAGLARWTQAG